MTEVVSQYDPQPYPSWVIDPACGCWVAPKEYPNGTGKVYQWDESILNWVLFPNERIV